MKATATAETPTTMGKTVKFKMQVDRNVHARVKALATLRGTTAQALMNRAVMDFVKANWNDIANDQCAEERG